MRKYETKTAQVYHLPQAPDFLVLHFLNPRSRGKLQKVYKRHLGLSLESWSSHKVHELFRRARNGNHLSMLELTTGT